MIWDVCSVQLPLFMEIKMDKEEASTSLNAGRKDNSNLLNATRGFPLNQMNPYQYIQCEYCGIFGHIASHCSLLHMWSTLSLRVNPNHQPTHFIGPAHYYGGIPLQPQHPVLLFDQRTYRPEPQYLNRKGRFVPNQQATANLRDIRKKNEDERRRIRRDINKRDPEDFAVTCSSFDIETLASDRTKAYSEYLQQLVDKIRLKEKDHEQHEKLRSSLQSFSRKRLNNNSIIVDFSGSARNGFGCQNCDLDLCLDGLDSNLSSRSKINRIAPVLRQCPQVKPESVLAITAAKVPIVKFTAFAVNENVASRGIEYNCDLSFSNDLALKNTQLLKTYSRIDERVASLGILVKYWAKICNICDASQGSLSSYAYIILVLHYLQKKKVLPVLQELIPKERDSCPEIIVDGCNVWFFKDLDKLKDVWPEGFDKNKNQESLLELFFGFLKYYGQEFDFENNVITCRTSKTVTRKDKNWEKQLKQSLAIEDPFLINRNLSCERHHSIFYCVVSCFRASYNHLVSRLTFFDPRFTKSSAEVEALFDFNQLCPFHYKTVLKFRCKCGRLLPLGEKPAETGNCIH